jgi:hypothetical protein
MDCNDVFEMTMISVIPNALTYTLDCGIEVTIAWDGRNPSIVRLKVDKSDLMFEFELIKDLRGALSRKKTVFGITEVEGVVSISYQDKTIQFAENLKQILCEALFDIKQHALSIHETVACYRKLQAQKKELTQIKESLERKNRQLDALHFVWCDGGCNSGVHRWIGKKEDITDELVTQAQGSIRRLSKWYENYKFRQLPSHQISKYFKTFKCKLRRLLDKWYWKLSVK